MSVGSEEELTDNGTAFNTCAMKKVFDQTVRDLKREVNKKVLKIPGIEQKILDATSNEPWGPHGSVLADIAQATRNYHEYQIIMTVIWKRINDTRKNWRHVYKGLSVLEYLVAHGSERVIDEIREHAYQISTLSDFQYTDSSGRDQGSNVRRKSQNLVALVNDKERIQEVRQKAHVNRDKSNDTYSTGGMHQPSPYSGRGGYGDLYDDEHYDGRYGNRDDQNGRDRESRDVDRYTRGGDLNNRGGDRYSRDTDEHCDRDGSRDDEHKGSRGNDHDFGSRSRSTDGEEDHSSNGDHRHSSRDGHGRTDKPLHGKRQLECKYSDKSLGAPPSYEEATGEHQNYVQDERDGGSVQSPLPKAPSPALPQVSSLESVNHGQTLPEPDAALSQTDKQIDSFDEFDPRGSVAATAPAGTGPEVDIFGLSAVDPITSSALMPVIADATSEPDILNNLDLGTNLGTLSSAANVFNQIVDDPFGDSPFKAIPQDDNSFVQQQNLPPVTYFQPQSGSMSDPEAPQPVAQMMQSIASFDFGDSFHATTPNVMINQVSTRTSETLPPELATPPDTVPPGTIGPHSDAVASGSIVLHPHAVAPGSLLPHMETTITASSHVFQPGTSATAELNHTNILSQPAPSASQEYVAIYLPHSGLSASTHPQVSPYSLPQWGSATLPPVSQSFPSHHLSQPGQSAPIAAQIDTPNPLSELGISISPQDVPSSVLSQPGLSAPLASQAVPSTILSQPGLSAFASSQVTPPAPTGPPTKSTQREDRFETKSTVWADTLSRGLVNLNISGPKINPLAEIGIDFESINRKEKRKEKEKTSAAPVSTVTMGKAMGTGSGIGRAGASALAPSSNPMMGSGKGMGMSMGNGGVSMGMGNGGMSMGIGNGGMNMGMGMGVGYGGGMSQPMGMGMGMGTNMGMGVNLGMGQAAPIQPPAGIGLPAGPATPAFGYNMMMGMGGPGGYGSQQQYGGYR